MRNYAKKHPVLGLSLLAAATVSLSPLSCKSTGIADLYMSPDQDGARNQSVFYAGEPVSCILKMASGRVDETLIVSFQPLEANGDVLDLPPQLAANTAPGKQSDAILGTPFPVPAVVAFANPTAVLITAPDSLGGTGDIQSRTGLLNDIRAKMLTHFADGAAHHMPDTSGVNPPMSPDATSDAAAFALEEEVKALFISHIGSTDFHDFADSRDIPSSPTPDPTAGGGNPVTPTIQATTALSNALNGLKAKMNAHIATLVVKPGQTAGKYRCIVQLADQTQSVDFVILPGGIPEPPPMSMIPRVGQCDGDPVANCPDPMKGPNILRCCTMDGACGSGPRGTPFCY